MADSIICVSLPTGFGARGCIIPTASPSQPDQHLTTALKQVIGLVDVRVLDHFVVAGGQVLSFAEKGLI